MKEKYEANRSISLSVLFLLLAITNTTALAHSGFYEGKTVRIIVGLAPGGGYDVYVRTSARHLGKHIPGHPSVVVQNMTGAGIISEGRAAKSFCRLERFKRLQIC